MTNDDDDDDNECAEMIKVEPDLMYVVDTTNDIKIAMA